MMANLFSIFDPSTPNFFSSNWASIFLLILLMPTAPWTLTARMGYFFTSITRYLYTEFNLLVEKSPFILLFPLVFFLLIATNNVMGLAPYIFTGTSHLTFTLSLALPIWLGLMLYGWIKNTYNLLVHLIPESTPALLMPFMVLIESISNLIRPLTLAVRLTANMVAGHLLISLLSSADSNTPMVAAPLLWVVKLALLILELAVTFIQAYVFSVLVTLYAAEFST